LTVYSFIDGIMNKIKKTGGVFEIFIVNRKFQFDLTNIIIDEKFKNNNI